jgi:hypothetical protein
MQYRLRTLLTVLVVLPLVLALAVGLAMLFGPSQPPPSPSSITIKGGPLPGSSVEIIETR